MLASHGTVSLLDLLACVRSQEEGYDFDEVEAKEAVKLLDKNNDGYACLHCLFILISFACLECLESGAARDAVG